jgi:hypothetical protein
LISLPAVAPDQLPFAPRPLPQELVSSWLMRVAAENFLSLEELLAGFASRHLIVSGNIDHSLPGNVITGLSRFCRVPPSAIRRLTIAYRAPKQSPLLMLRFGPGDLERERASTVRARYAFCPACLSEQPIIHTRWEWSLAFLVRCRHHQITLEDACPTCGRYDPLTFTNDEHRTSCRHCQACLCAAPDAHAKSSLPQPAVEGIEAAYQEAILGIAPNPNLLRGTTDRQFRQFVEDLLTLLSCSFGPDVSISGTPILSRHNRVRIVHELILNAAPASTNQESLKKRARGIKLWLALMRTLPTHRVQKIQKASLCWPPPLQNRLAGAVRQETCDRWPYSPFESYQRCPRFKYQSLTLFGLNLQF